VKRIKTVDCFSGHKQIINSFRGYIIPTKNFSIMLGIALAALSASTLAAGGRGTSTPTPVITSASIAPSQGRVTIHGYAFGTAIPQVVLGEQVLLIKQNSEKEIVAQLPTNLLPATYRLHVVRNNVLHSQPFTLFVMAN
jgi:hypothetical protein